MKNIPRRTSSYGFTLTELLVVILIIVALAVLSLTIFSRMRSMADKASVARSLSQLQIANISYAGDHEGRYVPFRVNDEDGNRVGFWFNSPDFLTYLRGDIYDENGQLSDGDIPPSLLDPKAVRARQRLHERIFSSYGINVNGLPKASTVKADGIGYRTSNVTKPEQSMAFATATDLSVRHGARFNWDGNEGKTTDSRMAYRHDNKAMIVYFDGHVGELSKNDMKEIDRRRGGSRSALWRPDQD